MYLNNSTVLRFFGFGGSDPRPLGPPGVIQLSRWGLDFRYRLMDCVSLVSSRSCNHVVDSNDHRRFQMTRDTTVYSS